MVGWDFFRPTFIEEKRTSAIKAEFPKFNQTTERFLRPLPMRFYLGKHSHCFGY